MSHCSVMSHCSAIIIQSLQSLVIVWSCTTAQLWQPISAWLSFLVCLFPFLWNYCTLLLLTALSASCRISAFLVYSTAFYLHLSKHKKWSTPWTPNQNNTVGLISLSHFDMIFTVNWVWRSKYMSVYLSSVCVSLIYIFLSLSLSLSVSHEAADVVYCGSRLPPMWCWRMRRLRWSRSKSTMPTRTRSTASCVNWGSWRRMRNHCLRSRPSPWLDLPHA